MPKKDSIPRNEIHHFYNKNTETHEYLTSKDFKDKYDLWRNNISKLIRGEIRSVKNWIVIHDSGDEFWLIIEQIRKDREKQGYKFL